MGKINYEDKIALTDYTHLYKKAEYDFKRYKSNYGLYELTDCLLTLNALPEWIQNSENAPEKLIQLASATSEKMKNLELDELKLSHDIYQKLRFVRVFSNHTKHATPKEKFPKIVTGFPLPQKLPAAFTDIQIGEIFFNAEQILKDIFSFWQDHFKKN